MEPEVQPPTPVQQSSLKDFKQNHQVFSAFIISFLIYLISSNVVDWVPGLYFFHLLIILFLPIYIIQTIYESVTHKKVGNNIQDQLVENIQENPEAINKSLSKLILILLGLELPLLAFSLYVYWGNGGSHFGNYGVLMFIFGVTIFLPNIIAVAAFGSRYLKDFFKNRKYLSRYSIANFILLGIQLYLYFELTSYL